MIHKQQLVDFLSKHNIPLFRATQVLQGIYHEGKDNFDAISVLPKNLRELLDNEFSIFCFASATDNISADKKTIKTLFELSDGNKIEGVLMRFRDGRNSVCVSSQVGCGLKCKFCATGTLGLKRDLKAEEIVDQVAYFNKFLKKENVRVTHVIFMGMGEPFLNYDEVLSAIKILNSSEYLGVAARHITVSTSGIIPGIKRFSEEKMQINLAISLHAPTQKLRESIMPIAKIYMLSDLMSAVRNYIKITNRRVSYEYVMLKDINDSETCAKELVKLVRGQNCHINLIPYNETYLGFTNAGRARIDSFKKILELSNIQVTVRVSLGQDIKAACGQLAS